MKKKKYTILTTCPDHGSRNVGDKLIEQRTKELIAEDARGYGFNQTFGIGGVTGFHRVDPVAKTARKQHTSGYCTTLSEFAAAPPRTDVHRVVRDMLEDELHTKFRRYTGIASFLDETYERGLAPFLHSLPYA